MIKEYKESFPTITKRITVKDEGKTLEIHSTTVGFPIRFEITDGLRNFLRTI